MPSRLLILSLVLGLAQVLLGIKGTGANAHVGASSSSAAGSSRSMLQTAANGANGNKKGVGVWYVPVVEGVMEDLGVSWYYTWTVSTYDESIVPPPSVEFVPTFYDVSDINDANIEKVKQEPCDAVMVFNEPDRFDQGAVEVAEALEVWPKLESLGKKLGAPATGTRALQSAWLSEFLYEAEQRGLRVDFVVVHWFGNDPNRWDADVATRDLKTTLENIYDKYKKPIWVTEFALTQWESTQVASYPSAEVQAAFVTKACEMMDGLDYVERYAYFPVFPYTDNSQSHLYETDGRITVVGEAYKNA
ncbi:hypothetical protein Ndes2526B_g05139 [Nannochloris sp. 'desiccata']|nr:putative Alkali-sensitive linkage protein 1 [Chlorella desiccata (nom. nud.)]